KPHAVPATPAGVQLTTTQRKVVTLPLVEALKPDQVRAFVAAKPAERRGELVLSLEGIEFDQLPGVDYEGYLNLPAKTPPNPDGPYYVGTLTFFGMKHPQGMPGHGAHKAPQHVKFAVSERLRGVLADNPAGLRDFQVTFVPQTGTEPVRPGAAVAGPAERQAGSIRQVRSLLVRGPGGVCPGQPACGGPRVRPLLEPAALRTRARRRPEAGLDLRARLSSGPRVRWSAVFGRI